MYSHSSESASSGVISFFNNLYFAVKRGVEGREGGDQFKKEVKWKKGESGGNSPISGSSLIGSLLSFNIDAATSMSARICFFV